MKIHGLMKMTLLDFPEKVACTVFLGGCDMRCPYCHNWELIDGNAPAIMEEEELYRFLEGRKGLLDGVVFTGGEPTLRKDLMQVMQHVRDMGFAIKLDTNGNHPDRLKEIVESGLIDYVAMDIKNCPEKYGMTIGLPQFDPARIMESVDYLLQGTIDFEFRTTVLKQYHDEDSFQKIGPWIKGAPRYYLQGFVDRDTVPVKGLEAHSKEQMERFLEIVTPYVGVAELRGV